MPSSAHIASAATGAPATTRERDAVIDTMRGIAILMVIGIHSLPRDNHSAIVIAIDAVFRPCVPIFLFASGYLSAGTADVPLARRLRRILGPYTIAFIAAYAYMAAENPQMDHRPAIVLARYGLAYVFVYYYVFVYAGCTLMLWCISRAAGRDPATRRSRLALFVGLTIVAGLLAGAYLDPLLQRLGVAPQTIEEARLRDLPFWFGFMAAGFLVRMFAAEGAIRRSRAVLIAAAVAAYGFYAASRILNIGDAADYDSIAYFAYAVLFCLALTGLDLRTQALAALGAASYFIYLWHIFIIMALRDYAPLMRNAAETAVINSLAGLTFPVVLLLAIRSVNSARLSRWLGA